MTTTTTKQLRPNVRAGDHARNGDAGSLLSDAQRLRLCELAEAGATVRQIAAELGIGLASVSKYAKLLGVSFDRSATEAATAARVVDARARRAELAVRLLEVANAELDRLSRPHRVHAFVGGQAPTYLEHVLPQPDAPSRLAIARTVATLLDRHVRLAEMGSNAELEATTSMLGNLQVALHRYCEDADRPAAGTGEGNADARG